MMFLPFTSCCLPCARYGVQHMHKTLALERNEEDLGLGKKEVVLRVVFLKVAACGGLEGLEEGLCRRGRQRSVCLHFDKYTSYKYLKK